MHFTAGNDVATQLLPLDEAKKNTEQLAAGLAQARLTAFEPYVKWMLLEPKAGQWDFRYYDMQVEVLKQHGLRWVPFLIAGPAYSTPQWFKDSPQSVFARCLEHGQTTRTQSIWNPHLPQHIDALLKSFGAHFEHRQIQTLMLGISGDFGESIYTAGGNEWTYKWDGEYHQHVGWWCGDEYAIKDFQNRLRLKYKKIKALNAAWGTTLGSFEQIKTFIPDAKHGRRANLDMTQWYRNSMTRFAEMWLQAAHKYLPDVQVLLTTGGNGGAALGADFSAQAIMAARYGTGIRITNEASDYETNFVYTRWVGASCRNLGTYFGYEPAGEVTEKGIVARIYNAVASGADELFIYDTPPGGERADIYARLRPLMKKSQPDVPIAFFIPKTSQELDLLSSPETRLFAHAAAFRDYSDFDFIDESLIDEGFLSRYKALVWTDGPCLERKTLEKIARWTKRGGKLFRRVRPESPEGMSLESVLAGLNTDFRRDEPDITKYFEYLARAVPDLLPDGKADKIYWTRFKDGSFLVLNYSDAPFTWKNLTIGPADIAHIR